MGRVRLRRRPLRRRHRARSTTGFAGHSSAHSTAWSGACCTASPSRRAAFVEHRRRPHQRQPRHRQRDCPSPRADRFPPPPPPDPRAGGNPPPPPCGCRAPAWRRPDRARFGLPQNRRRCREPPGHVVRVPQFRPPAGLRPRARVAAAPAHTRPPPPAARCRPAPPRHQRPDSPSPAPPAPHGTIRRAAAPRSPAPPGPLSRSKISRNSVGSPPRHPKIPCVTSPT